MRRRGESREAAASISVTELPTGGEAALAVLMAEKLPELLEIAVGAAEGVYIHRVVVMDGGKGEGVSNTRN